MSANNELYEMLENASDKIQNFLDANQYSEVHASIILKQEELNDRMYDLDLEAIRKQSGNLNKLNDEIAEIQKSVKNIIEELENTDDFISTAAKIVKSIDKVLTQVSKLL